MAVGVNTEIADRSSRARSSQINSQRSRCTNFQSRSWLLPIVGDVNCRLVFPLMPFEFPLGKNGVPPDLTVVQARREFDVYCRLESRY